MGDPLNWQDILPPLHPFPNVPVVVDGWKKGILVSVSAEDGAYWRIDFQDGSHLVVSNMDDFRYDLDEYTGFLYCVSLVGRQNDWMPILRAFKVGTSKGRTEDYVRQLGWGREPTDEDRVTIAQILRSAES